MKAQQVKLARASLSMLRARERATINALARALPAMEERIEERIDALYVRVEQAIAGSAGAGEDEGRQQGGAGSTFSTPAARREPRLSGQRLSLQYDRPEPGSSGGKHNIFRIATAKRMSVGMAGGGRHKRASSSVDGALNA